MIYGAIDLCRRNSQTTTDPYLSAACEKIAKLPACREDDEWPFLNQEHFSIGAGYYKTGVLTFGGTLKQVEYDWDHWLEKFEAFLDGLCWQDCYLHLRTEISGSFDYQYKSELVYDGEPGRGIWVPPTNWRLTGGPRCNSSQDLWFDESQRSATWLRIDGAWSQEAP